MAAVTATKVDASYLAVPGIQVYEVTADDGDHLIAGDFTQIVRAQASYAEDPSTGNPVGTVIDTTTLNKVTLQCTGASGVKFHVLVVGR